MSNDIAVDLTQLNEIITDLETTLNSLDPVNDSDDYAKITKILIDLYDARKSLTPEPVVDKDRVRFKDWIPVIGSIGGILAIIAFDLSGHRITTPALNFVSKLKS